MAYKRSIKPIAGTSYINGAGSAKMLNITLWEMIETAGKNNIDWIGYDKEDLERDLKIVKYDK